MIGAAASKAFLASMAAQAFWPTAFLSSSAPFEEFTRVAETRFFD
jgi:hypothetical protein